MATLRVMSTSDPKLQGRSFDLAREIRIGRDPATNDVVVSEGRVSRRHARITSTPEGMVIVDEGSDNGVWIGQQRVTRHVLVNGDQFGIGETTFRFEDPLEVRQTIVMEGPPRATEPTPSPLPIQPAPLPLRPAAPASPPPAIVAGSPSPPPAAAPAQPPAQPYPQQQPSPQQLQPQQPQPPATPQKASGCALGCLIASILLFLTTIGGSVIVLYRTGYLPGTHTERKVP
jgi:pSer/pThr/pTyr-binding forkhead associated (FHA) protein